MDYFLPARLIALLRDRAGLPNLRILLEGPSGTEPRVFASILDFPDESDRSSCRLGPYRLEVPGLSGADRLLSLLGASLSARMAASRPPCMSRGLPPERTPPNLAEAAAVRFEDSQAGFATLCVLDLGPFLDSAQSAFPSIQAECLQEDLTRCLSAFFEAAGGLFLCDSGELAALICGSRPADTGLLQSQLSKYIRKFISPAVDAPVRILRSRVFEAPRAGDMEAFLADCSAGAPV